MCSVIGALIKNPKKEHFDMIRKVFLESRIRGLHATGMSILLNDKILTFKEPVPANKFIHLDDLEEMVNEDGNLYLIGHCRYSTSDLEFNQPIYNETCSVVHNGVITQELYEDWELLHGYTCEGKNDTELLLRSLADYSPLEHWKQSSMSVCELHIDKKLRVYRNGKRPLYLTNIQNGSIITSTRDISSRANIGIATEIPMNTYLTIDSDLSIVENVISSSAIDLQNYNGV
jgi:glutamine phosphoribosylpyrophosphate amidotransferase